MNQMDELYNKYLSYFDTDQKAMAASLSAIKYSVRLINSFKLSRILDLGSGVSTLIFTSKYKNITSVDTADKWASKTEIIISELLGLNVPVHTDFSCLSPMNYDFVFYDYGNLEDRIFNFPKLLELQAPFVYLDDIHILPYRYYVESKIRDYRLVFLPETIDEFGRFGALLVHKNAQS